MSKLWLIGLAASAAWTPAAIAQTAPAGAMGPHPMPPAGTMIHHPMPGGHMPGMHRIGRGGFIPPFFMGPQFIVHDWRMFGFPPPMPGGHWVRFYDDALLVDRDGRVMDGRYGWDWDRRRDRDDYDDHGYDDDDEGRYGRRDRDDDHRSWDRDDRRRVVRTYRHDGRPKAKGDCRRRCDPVRHVPPPPPRHHGYGYGYGYGYGCGCGPIVITETTTTTAPVVETRTYYETVTERVAPRRHYRKPVRRAPPPPPPPRPGERG
ncbi:MAG TPA: RcnB family protein [Allosphingosinicella sp.]